VHSRRKKNFLPAGELISLERKKIERANRRTKKKGHQSRVEGERKRVLFGKKISAAYDGGKRRVNKIAKKKRRH